MGATANGRRACTCGRTMPSQKIGAVLPSELRHRLDDNAFHVSYAPAGAQAVALKLVRQAMQ